MAETYCTYLLTIYSVNSMLKNGAGFRKFTTMTPTYVEMFLSVLGVNKARTNRRYSSDHHIGCNFAVRSKSRFLYQFQ